MMYGIKTQQRKMLLLLLGVDAAILIAAIHVSYYLRMGKFINVLDIYTGASMFTVLVCLASFYIFDLYEFVGGVSKTSFAVRLLMAMTVSAALLPLFFYSLPFWKFGRGTLLYTVLIFSLASLFWRKLFEGFFVRTIRQNRIVLVGRGELGDEIASVLSESPGFRIISRLDDKDPATAEDLLDMSRRGAIDSISLDLAAARALGLLPVLLRCKVLKVDVFNMSDMYESLTGKVPVRELDEARLVSEPFMGMRRNVYMLHLKRLCDICLASTGLLVTLPVSLFTMLLIKLTSRGPVLFSQERVGLDGRVFHVLKFRSMRLDAERGGAVWATEHDTRITPVGKLLRKMRIDEIPQMWNVLIGDMSFIGPRPERPEFVTGLSRNIPFYQLRHVIKPGITGWAQINFRYGASMEDSLEKLQYDLYYIKNLGFMLDMQILFKTVKVVLFGAGAR